MTRKTGTSAAGGQHRCINPACKRMTSVSKLGCPECWASIPKAMQDAIWKHYRKGQETGARPVSRHYRAALMDVVRLFTRRQAAAREAARVKP